MQTLAPHKSKATELERIVDSWERRHEWRLLSRTAPRSLIAALLLSLLAGLVGYFRLGLRAEQLALLSAGLCAAGGVLNLLYTLLFPRSLAERAAYFDLEFGLRERISTAFELMHGHIKTHPEIESRQIAEALEHARVIDPGQRISLDFRPRELALLALLAVALTGLILLPAIVGEELLADAPSPAIEAAQEEVREIIETVATDTNLDNVDRQDLLEALDVALERLQEEDISEEEAFAAMSQLQEQLDELQRQLEETAELDQSATEAALEALEDFAPSSDMAGADEDSAGSAEDLQDLLESLEQLGQEAAQMSAEEARQAAEALRQAAEAMEQTNPELAQQFREMADALENNDSGDLQESLSEAQQQLEQEQGQRQQNQNARSMLQEQAEEAGETAEAIAQQQAQAGEQPAPDPRQGPAEQSESGQQSGGQQGQEASASQPGNNPGDQQPQQNRPGEGENAGRNQDSRSAGAGAGEGAPSNESLPGSAGEDQGAQTDNNPSGLGEIQYEALYSPSGIGGGGSEEIRLQTDASDTTLAEGDFDDNPAGESRVSYDTVFSDYQNAANRALESDYVPLGLRDVVREYFTSLEPNGS